MLQFKTSAIVNPSYRYYRFDRPYPLFSRGKSNSEFTGKLVNATSTLEVLPIHKSISILCFVSQTNKLVVWCRVECTANPNRFKFAACHHELFALPPMTSGQEHYVNTSVRISENIPHHVWGQRFSSWGM